MSGAPQNVLDLLNSLIHAYPTGLPDGIHININLDVKSGIVSIEDPDSPGDLDEPDDTPQSTQVGPVYEGPFLGLYRVTEKNDSQRIKVRSDCDPVAPELSVRLTPRHLSYMRFLNPTKPAYLETNGYIYETTNTSKSMYYRQYAFTGQLVVVAETRRIGKAVMGRVVGIGTDPHKSDPKPLDAAVTNNNLTPWLVHQIPGVLVYAPIFAPDTGSGWVNMDEIEKIR